MSKFLSSFLALVTLLCVACGEKNTETPAPEPVVEVTVVNVLSTSASFSFRAINTDHLYIHIDENSTALAEDVRSLGKQIPLGNYTAENLVDGVVQYAHVLPVGASGNEGKVQNVKFETKGLDGSMYKWERERPGVPSLPDMVLCYGGSAHRKAQAPIFAGKWTKERFAPMVSCKDANGNEQWLFDSFLFLDFVMTQDDLTLSYDGGEGGRNSATKDTWQKFLNYWFEKDNGFDALEKAVESATNRIGAPDTKRYVVMALPDALLHQHWSDRTTPTEYWGNLNGKNLDFAIVEDRLAAEYWFIDETRRLFNEADFKHIELAGFYIISEDLAVYKDGVKYGWSPELKENQNLYPAISRYLHNVNEGIFWIPYFQAGGYQLWSYYEIDSAMMQPNYYWKAPDDRWDSYVQITSANNLGMELEFDETIVTGGSGLKAEVYRERLRAYMNKAKANRIWGFKDLSLYHGDDGFYMLYASEEEEDKQMFRELCDFFLNNPKKKK